MVSALERSHSITVDNVLKDESVIFEERHQSISLAEHACATWQYSSLYTALFTGCAMSDIIA